MSAGPSEFPNEPHTHSPSWAALSNPGACDDKYGSQSVSCLPSGRHMLPSLRCSEESTSQTGCQFLCVMILGQTQTKANRRLPGDNWSTFFRSCLFIMATAMFPNSMFQPKIAKPCQAEFKLLNVCLSTNLQHRSPGRNYGDQLRPNVKQMNAWAAGTASKPSSNAFLLGG